MKCEDCTFCRLGNLVTFTSGGTPSKSNPNYWNGNIPWISAKTMKMERVSTSDLFITEDGLQAGSRLAKQGSILILTRGSGLFNDIPICLVEKDLAFNQDIKCLNSCTSIDNKFIFYWLLSQKGYLSAKVGMTGIGAGKFDTDFLMNLMVPIFSTEVRNRIVAIADSISEKIAINRAINENLQQQARALYKSWFVDFEPFDKRMPDLWKIGKLKDVLCLRKEVLKAGERTDLCYLPIDTIPMNTFALTSTRPNEEAQSSLLAFYRDDIIIGAMRVYFHRVIIAPFDGITRSTCFVLTPKDPNYLAIGLLCCDQDESIDFAQQSSKGSTMPYAVWDGGLGELEIAIPSQDIASEFNRIIMPMIREIQKSYYETEILNNIRDTLLPKLMSGEIDVSAVQL